MKNLKKELVLIVLALILIGVDFAARQWRLKNIWEVENPKFAQVLFMDNPVVKFSLIKEKMK